MCLYYKKENDLNNTIFGRSDISARAKGIYAFLLNHKYPISKKDLHNYFKEGRDSLSTAFNELVENDYVTIEKVRNEKGNFIGSEIHILKEDGEI